MSIVYISGEDGKIYSFDATETFGFREAGSLTEYTIESGAKVSDHYVNENKEISTTGIITDVKTQGSVNKMSCEEYIKGITDLKNSKTPFKVFWRNESNLLERFFDNVMFVDVSFNQDNTAGYVNGMYAYKVALSMKQIQFSDRAVVSKQMVPALKGSSAVKKTTNATTKNTLPAWRKAADQQRNAELNRQVDPQSIYVNDGLQRIKYGPQGAPVSQ